MNINLLTNVTPNLYILIMIIVLYYIMNFFTFLTVDCHLKDEVNESLFDPV